MGDIKILSVRSPPDFLGERSDDYLTDPMSRYRIRLHAFRARCPFPSIIRNINFAEIPSTLITNHIVSHDRQIASENGRSSVHLNANPLGRDNQGLIYETIIITLRG